MCVCMNVLIYMYTPKYTDNRTISQYMTMNMSIQCILHYEQAKYIWEWKMRVGRFIARIEVKRQYPLPFYIQMRRRGVILLEMRGQFGGDRVLRVERHDL